LGDFDRTASIGAMVSALHDRSCGCFRDGDRCHDDIIASFIFEVVEHHQVDLHRLASPCAYPCAYRRDYLLVRRRAPHLCSSAHYLLSDAFGVAATTTDDTSRTGRSEMASLLRRQVLPANWGHVNILSCR